MISRRLLKAGVGWRRQTCSQQTSAPAVKSPKKDAPDLCPYVPERIRNFSIVAHVDHGKSTLADRLLELTGTVMRGREPQILDKLRVERERGITVKAQTSSMFFQASDGESYLLNLIDTPGHVDFSYEVSRSLSACDGILLLVDANQGVQAQTVANFWLAFEQDLTMIPVLNKIDLKTGAGVPEILERIVTSVGAPVGDRDAPFRALIFDSWFLHFRGAITGVLVKDGFIERGQQVTSVNSGKSYEVQEVGIMYPEPVAVRKLYAGQVGYIIANMRTVQEAQIGDTLCWTDTTVEPLPGFKRIKPVVFAGLFPVEPSEYSNLRNAVEKLALNDPSVTLENDQSPALGQGWRMGFLGLLHMEVFEQRLEQEYDASVILTAPSVPFKAVVKDNPGIRKRLGGHSEITIVDPAKFPEPPDISEFKEPIVLATIITPQEFLQEMLSLCNQRRGKQRDIRAIEGGRMMVRYELPLAEIVIDFFDQLKRISSGYASFDYELLGYSTADLVKLNILINSKHIEEFSVIVPRGLAKERGSELCKKLGEEIPRQQYDVVIAACVGTKKFMGKPIAREKLKAFRKDFTQKLKGNFGDPSRLAKQVKNQEKGKAKLRQFGQIQIPKDAFINVMKRG